MIYRAIRLILPGLILLMNMHEAFSQPRREDIYSDYVLYQKRVILEKDLRERIIGHNFTLALDSNTEDKFMSACWAVSQFLFATPEVHQGFQTLFAGYDSISYDTKLAFLEAVYAVAPGQYSTPVRNVLEKETDPKLFAICSVYLYRDDTTTDNGNSLKIRMAEKFPGYDTIPILAELQNFLSYHKTASQQKPPDLAALFNYQRVTGKKIIYSLQRWNRDYPGLAIIQNADGQFVRNADGRLQIFEQLARSGPDLPYFITNGSTPQGVYSIQGTEVSRTNFIGPTPNFQLLLPFENTWDRYFHLIPLSPAGTSDSNPERHTEISDNQRRPAESSDQVKVSQNLAGMPPQPIDSLRMYLELLPPIWRNYTPMMEAWSAGKIGRSEIIAHGTTIDPEYFKDKPFYPLTPTMGCLCAKELWNPTSGHLLVSEQFNLVQAFLATPGNTGYLYVINVDDLHKPVSRSEAEAWVKQWEMGKK
jgi:hypothetical protein